MKLLTFASRQFAPKIVGLSVHFIHIILITLFPCEGAQRAVEAARGAKRLGII